MIEITKIIIAIAAFVGLVAFIDARGMSGLVPIGGASIAVFGVWMIYEIVNTSRQRMAAETKRRDGVAEREHALADYEYARAEKMRRDIPKEIELSREEKNLRGYSLNLIDQSIEKYGLNGNQIIPEDKSIGVGRYYWKQATDYMQSKGWIKKEETKPTVCNGTITLEVVKSALSSLT